MLVKDFSRFYIDLTVVICKSNDDRTSTLKPDRPKHAVSNKFRQIPSKFAAFEGASFVSIHVRYFPRTTTHVPIWIQSLFHLPLKSYKDWVTFGNYTKIFNNRSFVGDVVSTGNVCRLIFLLYSRSTTPIWTLAYKRLRVPTLTECAYFVTVYHLNYLHNSINVLNEFANCTLHIPRSNLTNASLPSDFYTFLL
jgi:hypothetical protein